MSDDALRRAVLLLMREALIRLDSQAEGTMYRTPGHKAWLEEQRQELRDLIDELSSPLTQDSET